MVKLWREDLGKINQKAAEALADPGQYKNLFPNLDVALQAEQHQVSCFPAAAQIAFADSLSHRRKFESQCSPTMLNNVSTLRACFTEGLSY